jgi:hypothetical protein
MKINWQAHDTKKLHLVATAPAEDDANDPNYVNFLSEEDMKQVWEWCSRNNCGTRMSFDTFKFRSKKHITMFLLRWS